MVLKNYEYWRYRYLSIISEAEGTVKEIFAALAKQLEVELNKKVNVSFKGYESGGSIGWEIKFLEPHFPFNRKIMFIRLQPLFGGMPESAPAKVWYSIPLGEAYISNVISPETRKASKNAGQDLNNLFKTLYKKYGFKYDFMAATRASHEFENY